MKRFLVLVAAALATAATVEAGQIGGPSSRVDTVLAFSSDTYQMMFRGGQMAQVRVRSYGDTYVTVGVVDQYGNVVRAKNDRDGRDCVLTWVPPRTATYCVIILNEASVDNDYFISAN